ncbi:MAG: hypothetical protein ACK4IS_13570, partial [Erythrobacter sp.]
TPRHNVLWVTMPAAGLPGLLLASDPVMAAIATGLPMLLADGLARTIKAIDYAGHGAEIMAGEAAGMAEYRANEVEQMRWAMGRSADEIEAGLQRWHWLARVVRALG